MSETIIEAAPATATLPTPIPTRPKVPVLRERRYRPHSSPAETREFVTALRADIALSGHVLIRRAGFDRTALRALLSALLQPGEIDDDLPARLRVRGTAPALPIPARVPPLPLHRDAVLIAAPSRLIAFCALDTTPRVAAGALELVDSVTALAAFPADLRTLLRTHDLQYRLPDISAFLNLPTGWFSRPALVETAAGTALNIALPRTGAGVAPWEIRLRGLRADVSAREIARVDDALRRSPAYVSHAWSTGDVVILDNSHILHGIAAVPANTRHHIIRESV